MAGRRSRRKRDNDGASEDWRHVLPVGGLIGAVLITLVVGAALRTESPATVLAPPRAADVPAATGATSVEPRSEAASQDESVDLAQRATSDARRIRSASAAWTLQFMLACDPVNIRSRVEVLADQPDFFLLPKQHDGQSCFRLCWGRFRSREQALATTSYPRALHEITAKPQALQIARALR